MAKGYSQVEDLEVIHKSKIWTLMKLLLSWLGLSQFVYYLPMLLTLVS
jgi:hypothetical protein